MPAISPEDFEENFADSLSECDIYQVGEGESATFLPTKKGYVQHTLTILHRELRAPIREKRNLYQDEVTAILRILKSLEGYLLKEGPP